MKAAELHAWMRSRHSMRRFKERPVPRPVVARILETACRAPSAHNRQPWRFVVLESREARKNVAQAMGAAFRRTLLAEGQDRVEVEARVARSRDRIEHAPVAVVLCLDPAVMDHYTDPVRQQGELTMAIQSVALAGGQMLLAAHAEGLGAVWICAPLFTPLEVRQAAGLPEDWIPQGMILIGYPAVEPQVQPRRPLQDVVMYL